MHLSLVLLPQRLPAPSPPQILHTPPDPGALAARVHARLTATLACQVSRLDTSYRALAAALVAGHAAGGGAEGQHAAQEAALRAAVERYFDDPPAGPAGGSSGDAGNGSQQTQLRQEGSGEAAPPPAASGAPSAAPAAAPSWSATLMLDTAGLPLKRVEGSLLQAARAVTRRNREQAGPALPARALARILHGVGSPGFPTDAWAKRMGAFWGSQALVDFGAVLRAAEIVVRDDA